MLNTELTPTPPSPDLTPRNDSMVDANPFAATDAREAVRGGANMYGTFSIEKFCDVGSLSQTHEDALGFYNYVTRFTPANFRYIDVGRENLGLLRDLRQLAGHLRHGCRACASTTPATAVWTANGVFYVPMGAAWAGNDCTARRTTCVLGNEYARYIFWSTCLSLRVLDGHTRSAPGRHANMGCACCSASRPSAWTTPTTARTSGRSGTRTSRSAPPGSTRAGASRTTRRRRSSRAGRLGSEAQNRVFNERLFYGVGPAITGGSGDGTWRARRRKRASVPCRRTSRSRSLRPARADRASTPWPTASASMSHCRAKSERDRGRLCRGQRARVRRTDATAASRPGSRSRTCPTSNRWPLRRARNAGGGHDTAISPGRGTWT